MISCSNCWCWAILLLLEWKLGLVRAFFGYLQRIQERYTAPRINVPLPSLVPSGPPAEVQLTPATGFPAKDKIQCFDKGTNAPLGVVAAVTTAEMDEIVSKARKAQVRWAQSTFAQRRKLMYALMDYVITHHKLLCETSAVECGKTMVDGTFGEILTTLEKLSWTAANGEAILADEYRGVGLITMHKHAVVRYVPFGVVGAIVSWNYPFHNIWGPMISALFAGNAFVGKVSEYSSFYAKFYESIVRDGLRQLGFPVDLVTFVTGYADTGSDLISRVDKVTFIGSPGVGKLVMKKASDTLTPVILELGGKDPAVILEDADMSQLLPIIMRGTFQNCGQNCVGLERIVVHEAIHDRLVNAVVKEVEKLVQGPTTTAGVKDLGAMTMGRASVDKIQKLVDDTVAAGARVLIGGRATADRFFPPTVIVGVTPTMPIAVEEVFGPILVVMKFQTDDEAVQIVNACPYGLGSSVFSANVARAKKLGQRLHTGMLNVNDFGINYLCQALPFGGCKVSGFDRFAGVEGLRGNCVVRAETYDRIPGVKTQVPPPLCYPMAENSFHFTELLAKVLYGRILTCVAACASLATFKKK